MGASLRHGLPAADEADECFAQTRTPSELARAPHRLRRLLVSWLLGHPHRRRWLLVGWLCGQRGGACGGRPGVRLNSRVQLSACAWEFPGVAARGSTKSVPGRERSERCGA